MTITATEARKLECVLVSSVLENPTARFGPNICTALAYAPEYWDSVEARIVAASINAVIRDGRPTHPTVVTKRVIRDSGAQYQHLVDHPMFKDALPLSSMEPEALLLVDRYHNKRIVATIARAYEKLIDKPELAKEVGRELVVKLENYL